VQHKLVESVKMVTLFIVFVFIFHSVMENKHRGYVDCIDVKKITCESL